MKTSEARELRGKRVVLYAKLTDVSCKYEGRVSLEPETVPRLIDGEIKRVIKYNIVLSDVSINNVYKANTRIRIPYKKVKTIIKYKVLD